ncbi:MAG: cell division protein SepF [Defluviitaleaceae bacterium]|nr:cell division protein SepF [Defluviitaleaceae bacterium]
MVKDFLGKVKDAAVNKYRDLTKKDIPESPHGEVYYDDDEEESGEADDSDVKTYKTERSSWRDRGEREWSRPVSETGKHVATSKVISIHDASPGFSRYEENNGNSYLAHPASIDECLPILDKIKEGYTVIVNLNKKRYDVGVRQRIIDFLAGAVVFGNGGFAELENAMYVATPPGADLESDMPIKAVLETALPLDLGYTY